jgi:hypothetical protein
MSSGGGKAQRKDEVLIDDDVALGYATKMR